MKEEKQDQENYFALRLGRRHHPPLIEHRLLLIEVLEDEATSDARTVKTATKNPPKVAITAIK